MNLRSTVNNQSYNPPLPVNPSFGFVKQIDQLFLFLILCLVSFGLVMVYSTGNAFIDQTYNGNGLRYFKVQLVAVVSGLGLMMAVSLIPYQFYAKHAKGILGLSILILLLVFTPLGYYVQSRSGMKFHRWIRLGGFGFQPVELVKLGMIIYTSNFLISKHERIKSFTQGILPNLIILALVFFLLYVQPDFGSAVLLSLVIILLLITGGARISQIFLVGVIAGFFVFIWMQGDNYKMQRIQDYVRAFCPGRRRGTALPRQLIRLHHHCLWPAQRVHDTTRHDTTHTTRHDTTRHDCTAQHSKTRQDKTRQN
ncbi:TPA: hypothetical protein EYO77_13900, partial [Candidatus Poribacteria bacterium]|nr:hypothetical protein [Candidatus Poribacteria bacterium]